MACQGGFNIHLMALEIPVSELGDDRQVVGVYATTSRRQVRILLEHGVREHSNLNFGPWVQVARQGNPLFNEGFVAVADKDLYSRTSPEADNALFLKYALNPELGILINKLVLGGTNPEIGINRADIAAIFSHHLQGHQQRVERRASAVPMCAFTMPEKYIPDLSERRGFDPAIVLPLLPELRFALEKRCHTEPTLLMAHVFLFAVIICCRETYAVTTKDRNRSERRLCRTILRPSQLYFRFWEFPFGSLTKR